MVRAERQNVLGLKQADAKQGERNVHGPSDRVTSLVFLMHAVRELEMVHLDAKRLIGVPKVHKFAAELQCDTSPSS